MTDSEQITCEVVFLGSPLWALSGQGVKKKKNKSPIER